jgi:ABC-2 type transport system ATP-binding protein
VLEIKGLTKRYDRVPVVDDVSFRIDPGEVCGYLGPNGSGKTTTVKMLTGLLDPSDGAIFFNGQDIRSNLIGYRKCLGYVPEEPHLYPYLSGKEYLELVGRLRSIPERLLATKSESLLSLFGLGAYQYAPISSYSKGMKQRILVCAALLHDPEVLIFDEPLSGLDVTSVLVFQDVVKQLAGEGKIVLYTSHILELTEKLCSRVMILHRGRVVANDRVERATLRVYSPRVRRLVRQPPWRPAYWRSRRGSGPCGTCRGRPGRGHWTGKLRPPPGRV